MHIYTANTRAFINDDTCQQQQQHTLATQQKHNQTHISTNNQNTYTIILHMKQHKHNYNNTNIYIKGNNQLTWRGVW